MKRTAKKLILGFVVALVTGAVAVVAIASAWPGLLASTAQQFHIAAHVPPRRHFDRLLERDITAYLTTDDSPAVVESVTLLRDEPSQAGVAHPKYYVWVEARAADGSSLSGAARIAAVDRVGFDVIQYRTCSDLLERPRAAASIFPAAVLDRLFEQVARTCSPDRAAPRDP